MPAPHSDGRPASFGGTCWADRSVRPTRLARLARGGDGGGVEAGARAAQPEAGAVDVDVDDGRGEQGQHLTDDQAAYDGDAQGAAEFGAGAGTEG